MDPVLYPEYLNPLLHSPERPLPREVAIVGAGTIGPDIGYYFKSSLPGIRLVLVDINERQLENAQKVIQGYVKKAVDKKKLKPEKAEAIEANIVYTTDYSEIKGADLVIEAATENLDIKKKIVRQIEDQVSENTIITSNTSSIPAGRIFAEARLPARTSITHFFAPAWRNPAVEIIAWEMADRSIIDYLTWMFAMTGKVPIVTLDKICFVFDRIFDNWCNDAAHLLETATAPQIDQVSREFVFAGPFFVLNLTNGNPIIVETNTLQMEEGEHYRPADILRSVEKWVTLGPGQKVEIDPQVTEKVRNRLLGVLFSQSFDIINRGIGTPEDLNLGTQIALGFRKGPMDIMRDLGEPEVENIISGFQQDRPGMPGMEKSFDDYQDFKRNILVDEKDGVKIITIRRPQVLNALNDEVNMEILDVLKKYESDPEVKGFVITGYGNQAFCAGADIGKFPKLLGNAEASIQYTREYSLLLRYLDSCPKPVVAAINGFALGGGFELAMRCHKLVAVEQAWFQLPEVTLGIVPGSGGLVVPYRRWPSGSEKFHDMNRLAARMTAREALDLGVLSGLAGGYLEVINLAIGEVTALAGKPLPQTPDQPVEIAPLEPLEDPRAGKLPLSGEIVEIISGAIREAAAESSFEKALEVGYRAFGDAASTEAAREGIAAFMEKRAPQYKK